MTTSMTMRGLALAAFLALIASLFAAAPPASAGESEGVRPIFECWEDRGDGTYRYHFGYQNDNGEQTEIPIGADNKFTGGPGNAQDQGQPTTFLSGDLPGEPVREGRTAFFPNNEFYIEDDGDAQLVWTLDGRTATGNNDTASQNCIQKVSPILECVAPLYTNGEETPQSLGYRAFFGYENPNNFEVTIPVGGSNKITGGGLSGQDQGQPTSFGFGDLGGARDGRTPFYPDAEFYVDFDGSNLVWTLNGKTATASSGSSPCDGAAEVNNTLECVIELDDGILQAFFGWENKAGYDVYIPAGSSDNAITSGTVIDSSLGTVLPELFESNPASAPDGRPNRTGFYPDAAFWITFDPSEGNLVWNLVGRTETASNNTQRCPEDDTPPVFPPSSPPQDEPEEPEEPEDPELPPAQETPEPERLGGEERIETAVLGSQQNYPDGTTAVVLARSDDPADAIAGTPFAVANDAPVLLTRPEELPQITLEEIQRLLGESGTIYIMGGTEAVSAEIASQLEALGYTVVRIGGLNRFGTATEIADRIFGFGEFAGAAFAQDDNNVLLADGGGFEAATVAGPAAAATDAAILLTSGSDMAPETEAWLADNAEVTATAIGDEAAAAAPTVDSITAEDAPALSRAVAEAYFPTPVALGFATYAAFPDPLVGATHIASRGGALLLSDVEALPTTLAEYVTANADTVEEVFIYGGTAALNEQVETDITDALQG